MTVTAGWLCHNTACHWNPEAKQDHAPLPDNDPPPDPPPPHPPWPLAALRGGAATSPVGSLSQHKHAIIKTTPPLFQWTVLAINLWWFETSIAMVQRKHLWFTTDLQEPVQGILSQVQHGASRLLSPPLMNGIMHFMQLKDTIYGSQRYPLFVPLMMKNKHKQACWTLRRQLMHCSSAPGAHELHG